MANYLQSPEDFKDRLEKEKEQAIAYQKRIYENDMEKSFHTHSLTARIEIQHSWEKYLGQMRRYYKTLIDEYEKSYNTVESLTPRFLDNPHTRAAAKSLYGDFEKMIDKLPRSERINQVKTKKEYFVCPDGVFYRDYADEYDYNEHKQRVFTRRYVYDFYFQRARDLRGVMELAAFTNALLTEVERLAGIRIPGPETDHEKVMQRTIAVKMTKILKGIRYVDCPPEKQEKEYGEFNGFCFTFFYQAENSGYIRLSDW